MIIENKQGSATSPRPDGDKGIIIAHLCNHQGAWGRGFVLAVNQLSQIPCKAYKEMAQRHSKNIPLGETQFCEVEPNLWVANMVAQNGIDRAAAPNGCLVDYKALSCCLQTVFERAVVLHCNVHIPSGMGSGLAGGNEQMIHDIIKVRSICSSIKSLKAQMKFEPHVTLWEFDDTTAASYVGKPPAAKVDSAFGTPDNGDNGNDMDIDSILDDL